MKSHPIFAEIPLKLKNIYYFSPTAIILNVENFTPSQDLVKTSSEINAYILIILH